MRRPTVRWSAIAVAAAALACGGSTQQELVTPSGSARCQMSLATPETLPATAIQTSAQLSTTRDCSWSAQTASPWLQLDPATGQGPATLTLTAAQNPQGRNRSATILINDQPFTVTQLGAPCFFDVTPPSLSIAHQGGRVSFLVSTLEGCVWSAQTSQPWVRVVTGSGGESSGSLEVAVDSNSGPDRSALLTVATTIVVVNQAAGPHDRTVCRFSLSPGSRRIAAGGGTGSFSLSTQTGCAWNAVADQPWITIVSGTNMIGSGPVSYRVEPNPLTTVRSGTIAAGTRRHVIQQDAAPRP